MPHWEQSTADITTLIYQQIRLIVMLVEMINIKIIIYLLIHADQLLSSMETIKSLECYVDWTQFILQVCYFVINS